MSYFFYFNSVVLLTVAFLTFIFAQSVTFSHVIYRFALVLVPDLISHQLPQETQDTLFQSHLVF